MLDSKISLLIDFYGGLQEAFNRRGMSAMASNGNGPGTPPSEVSSSYSMDFHTRNTSRQMEEKPATATVPSTFNNFNSLFSSGKKVFNRMTNSIDAALKPSMDDASDTVGFCHSKFK